MRAFAVHHMDGVGDSFFDALAGGAQVEVVGLGGLRSMMKSARPSLSVKSKF